MKISVLLLLRRARARCSFGGWSGVPACMNHHRKICAPNAEDATFFDMLGALQASAESSDDVFEAWEVLNEFTDGLTITWEDTPGRTEADVLTVFDRALARATALSRKGNG